VLGKAASIIAEAIGNAQADFRWGQRAGQRVSWGQLGNGGDQRGCGTTDQGKENKFENRLHSKLLAKRNLIFSSREL
jgi:hypothetical protein